MAADSSSTGREPSGVGAAVNSRLSDPSSVTQSLSGTESIFTWKSPPAQSRFRMTPVLKLQDTILCPGILQEGIKRDENEDTGQCQVSYGSLCL